MIHYSILILASIFLYTLPMELKKRRLRCDAPASHLYKVQKTQMPIFNQALRDLQSIRRKPDKRNKELQGHRAIFFTASIIACTSIPS